MKIKNRFALLLGLVGLVATSWAQKDEHLTQFVNPFIGTGDHGHVFLGANVPYGAVQLGPTNITHGWDWCSGYHISDSTIVGFAHTHLNGTGIGDLGDIALMPVVGDVVMNRGKLSSYSSGFYSLFSHKNEEAHPGYYSVMLDRYGIKVELTATPRVGFHRYVYPKGKTPEVVIDLEQGIGWDAPMEGYLVQENQFEVSGYRFSKGWANDQRVYFTARFSKPIKQFAVYRGTELIPSQNYVKATSALAKATFEEDEEPLLVKVAISPVSVENARLNMEKELEHWDFEKVRQDADALWNQELQRVKVTAKDPSVMRIFYTAMYHTMYAPSLLCDVNGDYRGADGRVYPYDGFTNYTTYSLWDTYRAAHPLMTLIHPDRVPDMITTMLDIYKKQGKLPVWHLMANETNCMVGNPGIPVVADALLKGFPIDKELAYEAMKKSALLDERGLDVRKKYGYIPFDLEGESVAKDMEYALADWSVAQVAKRLGKEEDYAYFSKMSRSYTHFFDPKLGFMRGKDSKGAFREPFNPFESVHRENDYTEGTAWQYIWLVPHDVNHLVELFGSEERFATKLDSLFIVKGDMGKQASSDITGLIGQYAHGNEPGHHTIYLYSFVGQQWKTAELARKIMTELYHDVPGGLSGNEDVGQMSAWYILSALGFYQVVPAGGPYIFGSPMIDAATIDLGNGKTLTIKVKNNKPKNKYIKKIKRNGKRYTKSYITYEDLISGGVLEIEMSAKPSRFGMEVKDRPVSMH